ncbi:MAG: HK97 gp10 family phage protein [Lachnospira sp.]|nr:HK97 gp10 family phage protein [Lachnospira sp.]
MAEEFVKADLQGFDDLAEQLKQIADNVDDEKALDAIQKGADELAADVRALPKPRSKMGGGHTHMLDTVGTQRADKAIEVGWGAYYGKMVENGHRSSKSKFIAAQPHLTTTWNQNKDKYYQTMIEALKLED